MTIFAPNGERVKSKGLKLKRDVRPGIHFPAMAWPYQGMGGDSNLRHAAGGMGGERDQWERHEAILEFASWRYCSVIDSVIQKQVDGQYVVHQVRAATDYVLVHVADLSSYVLVDGITKPRKETVLIEPSSRNPISIVKAHESFILDDVAEARRK